MMSAHLVISDNYTSQVADNHLIWIVSFHQTNWHTVLILIHWREAHGLLTVRIWRVSIEIH